MVTRTYLIRGDKANNGATISGGSDSYFWHNVPVAREGDAVYCPVCKRAGTALDESVRPSCIGKAQLMKPTASKAIRLVDLCAIAMSLLGIAFAAIAACTRVTLAQVTTGPLGAFAGITVLCAAVIAFGGLLPLFYILVRRPGERLRAFLAYTAGVVFFSASFLATDRWVTRQLPSRHNIVNADVLHAAATSHRCAQGARQSRVINECDFATRRSRW
ncbi:PAAR domain-containing protein [Cupriavidus oxalaticus]|uniref:PAAR domain-containing protein n=1 Tax=Cupriavidus oxalaticus TaxID=96344 RepID=UPI00316DF5AA